MIQEWIYQNAARRGDSSYLEAGHDQGTAGSVVRSSVSYAVSSVVSYADLKRAASAWAHRLDHAGIRPGARVAIRLTDPIGYATALVAVVGSGRVAVPLDPDAPAARLNRILEVARPDVIACSPTAGMPADLRAGGAALLRAPHWLSDTATGGRPVVSGGGRPVASGGGIFLCTSGTTGTPKGVLLTEAQLCHVAAAVAAWHELTPADRGYNCLPLFHVNAEVVGLLATLSAGAALTLDSRFSRRGFWPLIEERRITWINAVPAIITLLARLPGAGPAPQRVRFVRSASAPLPASVLSQFEARYRVPVVETYGMTEAASMITANPLAGPRKPGSAGLPAGAEVRIVTQSPGGTGGTATGARGAAGARDSAGARGAVPYPAGEIGRVQIRGRGVIAAYADGALARDADRADGADLAHGVGGGGWLDTGDLGYLDEDGYLFLAGRTDDVINRGGEKIYPREVEEFLLAQPGVLATAVVPVPDEVLGSRPVAFIVPAAYRDDAAYREDAARGEETTCSRDHEARLRAACDAGLPRYQRPSAFFMVDRLPTGPTGKVARRALAELAGQSVKQTAFAIAAPLSVMHAIRPSAVPVGRRYLGARASPAPTIPTNRAHGRCWRLSWILRSGSRREVSNFPHRTTRLSAMGYLRSRWPGQPSRPAEPRPEPRPGEPNRGPDRGR